MRGVTTVVHLAGSMRDQPAGSIEELNGIATWRMVQAAERAGVRRFVFASALGATTHERSRFLRAKALAEEAVRASPLPHVVVAPSLVYDRGDAYTTLLGRLALLPAVPMSGRGRARFQPIWAQDVADCVAAVLDEPGGDRERYELAGPETLTHGELVSAVLDAIGRPRRVVPVPTPVTSRTLRATEVVLKRKAPATWDEVELLEVSMTTPRGTADAEALGVRPRRLATVLRD